MKLYFYECHDPLTGEPYTSSLSADNLDDAHQKALDECEDEGLVLDMVMLDLDFV